MSKLAELKLADEERRALIQVIENLFANEQDLHTMLVDANLHRFLPETKFFNPRDATTKLIEDLERFGCVSEHPKNYHSLGALLSSLLELEVRPLDPSEARFFAWLIVHYSLVCDDHFIDKLRVQYSLQKILTAPLPIARPPSYPQSKSYAVLDIQLFARRKPKYWVQLRFSRPGDTIIHAPVSGSATFDVQELLKATSEPDEYGKCLTNNLFKDKAINQAIHQIYTVIEANNLPLRLRLFIDERANELHALWWETLFHPLKMDSPLLTNENILFSRFLGTSDFRQRPAFFSTPHKTLLAIANPTNITEYGINGQPFAAIPVQDELARAVTYLGTIPHRDIVSDPSSPGQVTLTNLIARLREGYTILYLICHGDIGTQKPRFYLEQADGTYDAVTVEALSTRIEHMSQRPQLVVLGSCQSVGDGLYDSDGSNMLTTLGPKLISAGVPSIVGMQGNISMETLAKFTPTFFTEWQSDGQLDRAMAVARRAVIKRNDWWMPVLFTQLINGRL